MSSDTQASLHGATMGSFVRSTDPASAANDIVWVPAQHLALLVHRRAPRRPVGAQSGTSRGADATVRVL